MLAWSAGILNLALRLTSKFVVPSQEILGLELGGLLTGGCHPQRVHLALMQDPTQMRVSWSTRAHNCHGNVYYGLVKAGQTEDLTEENNHLDMVVDHMDAGSYDAGDFCGKPAVNDDFEPPHLHTAIMSDLVPGALYKYRIDHQSKHLHFRAAPEVKPEGDFTFIAYGDMGDGQYHSAKSPGAEITAKMVTKEVVEKGASLVVHLGDISYADGKHKIWNSFMDQIEPYASRAPYQVVVGNHEYDWKTGKEKKHAHPVDASGKEKMYDPDWGNFGNDSGGECGVIVSKLFTMPGSDFVYDEASRMQAANHRSDIPNPPFWYSYDYGGVHFTTLSSEHDLTGGSHQAKWLKEDLAKVDRCVTPWLIVVIHRPLYVVFPHKSNRVVAEHLRKSLEETLEEYEVDLIMSGHIHAMSRTCNLYKGKCIKNKKGGIMHFILGNGGRKLSEVEHEQPDWLEYADRHWGFARVTVRGSESLTVEYVSSESGKVKDSVQLTTAPSAMKHC